MAVRSINQWQPHPGREAETTAAFSETKKIQEKLGARVRAWQHISDGAGPTMFSYALEVDSLADYLMMLDSLRKSAEFRAVLNRVVRTENPAAVRAGALVTTELPGMEAGILEAPSGSLVASVFQWQVKPGRLKEVIANGGQTAATARSMGATVSGWLNTYAGAGSGLAGAAFIFNGYAAMADFQRKAATNAEWLAHGERGRAADSPTILVSSALLAELPI